MRTALTIVAVAFAAFAGTSPVAHATSCLPPEPSNALADEGVVFEAVAGAMVLNNGGLGQQTELAVSGVYLGEVPKKVIVEHGGMKGYPPFEAGQRYLVFGFVRGQNAHAEPVSDWKPKIFVHLCGATHALPATGRFATKAWQAWDVQTAVGPRRAPSDTLKAERRKKVETEPGQSLPH